VFSTTPLSAITPPTGASPVPPTTGVMVYVRAADGNDALAWVNEEGQTVTESQHEILRAAACEPNTPGLLRLDSHHDLVQQGVKLIATEHRAEGGQLGRPTGARRRTYDRLKDYAEQKRGTLFDIKPLHHAIQDIYDTPLTEYATDLLNRELRLGIDTEKLAKLVLALHEEDRLTVPADDHRSQEPRIICSLGIRKD
jgi:hypothetical protein